MDENCHVTPYEGQEPYFFISYSHQDRARVFPVLEAMDRQGYRIWHDGGIPWDSEWPAVIENHLRDCVVCVAFHSAASADSKNCRQELNYALDHEKSILSVYLEDVSPGPGLGMRLAGLQWVRLGDMDGAIDSFMAQLNAQWGFSDCRRETLSVVWHEDRSVKGREIKWSFHHGILTIAKAAEGSGEMPDYDRAPNEGLSLAPWMGERLNITSVFVEEGITSIGGLAFLGCTELLHAILPESLQSIGNSAFSHCTRLPYLRIPKAVTHIGNYVFYDCHALTSVLLPDALVSIGGCAFWSCCSLQSVYIPDGVSSIPYAAFNNCCNLARVRLPKNVCALESPAAIESYAFCSCHSLTAVRIPDGVASIGNHAFYGCQNLSSIHIPDSVVSIGKQAFDCCFCLTAIHIPEGIQNIGDYAFKCCHHLSMIEIPDSVKEIGAGAFNDCYSLASVSIPADAEIAEDAFSPWTNVVRRSGL